MADIITDAIVSQMADALPSPKIGGVELRRMRFSERWKSTFGPSLDSFGSHGSKSRMSTGDVSNPIRSNSQLSQLSEITDDADSDVPPSKLLQLFQYTSRKYPFLFIVSLSTPLSIATFIMMLLVDFGKPTDKGYLYASIFSFLLPVLYVYVMDRFLTSVLHISSKNSRSVGMSATAGVGVFAMHFASGETWGYPAPLSLVCFFTVAVTVEIVWWIAMFFRAKNQGKGEKSMKILMVLGFGIFLIMGWSFATVTMMVFNKSGVVVQSLIVCGLAIWKAIMTQIVKLFSLLTHLHGERFEVLDVVVGSITVHWFWTLFTDIAFAAVESWWTYVVYLVVDFGGALIFLYQSTEMYQNAKWVKVPGRMFPKRVSLSATDDAVEKNYGRLFNMTTFALIQFGELSFALYTLLLFICMRYGPNASYSAVGPERVNDADFMHLVEFLLIMICSEGLVLGLFTTIGHRQIGFNPLPHLGDYFSEPKNCMLIFFLPVLLHLPCISLLLEHSGMKMSLGD